MTDHQSNTSKNNPPPPFTNDPSRSFEEWRSDRMRAEFGTDRLGMEYYPAGRSVVRDRWAFTPVMIPSALAFDQELTDKEKVLCITLHSASNATGYGGDAYRFLTDENELCKKLDMSHDELNDAAQKLHDMGYVNLNGKAEVPDFNRRNVNEYMLEEIGYRHNHQQYLESEAERERAEKSRENQAPKRPSRSISSSMRLRVYKHDGYQCVVCKSNEDLVVDHIVPLAKGGTNARENLQTMCSPCNSSKGVKSMDEWLASRGES